MTVTLVAPCRQCDAVTTFVGLINVPPQENCPWLVVIERAACHGQTPLCALVPPTISPPVSDLLLAPHPEDA